MKPWSILLFVLSLWVTACGKGEPPVLQTTSDSFMPLAIGNYWRLNEQNFTEVRDTVRLDGELYYKVYSLVGGDGIGEEYLRIDKQLNLISTSVHQPGWRYIKAKFNGAIGDSFQTLGDLSVNDYKVTIIEKTNSKITFSFDPIYHPNQKGHPHQITYIKGIGPIDNWKSMRINGKVYKR